MRHISHRGNLHGINPQKENSPSYLNLALVSGYDVEVDVWLLNGELSLGHDGPTYATDLHFLQNKRVWTHCKNAKAFLELSKFPNVNCFMQDKDEVALTSRGYLWANAYSKEVDPNRTVLVYLGKWWEKSHSSNEVMPFAICSDYAGSTISLSFQPSLFSLLIIDIDGVMTDGTKMYDRDGKVFGKRYCDLDFTAIKRFKAAGVQVCFLSGDETVNRAMAETRKIDFFHNPPGTDKIELLAKIKQRYPSSNMIGYVGDDYYDLSIMSVVDFSFCPQSAPNIIKKAAKTVIPVNAGQGVIAGLYDLFEEQLPYAFPRDSRDVNPV